MEEIYFGIEAKFKIIVYFEENNIVKNIVKHYYTNHK